jgi:hypothetical protein
VLPVELPGRVRVGVDGDPAARLDREPQQPLGRVEPLRAAVHLDRDVEAGAGGEDQLGVELALRPALAAAAVPEHLPAGAVARARRCAGC